MVRFLSQLVSTKMQKEEDGLCLLSMADEMLLAIASYCSIRELGTLSCVDHRLHDITNSEELWKSLWMHHFFFIWKVSLAHEQVLCLPLVFYYILVVIYFVLHNLIISFTCLKRMLLAGKSEELLPLSIEMAFV